MGDIKHIRKWLSEAVERRKAEDSGPLHQIGIMPEEAKTLLADHCPEEMEPLRDALNKGPLPTHVLLRVDEVEAILNTPAGKDKPDANKPQNQDR